MSLSALHSYPTLAPLPPITTAAAEAETLKQELKKSYGEWLNKGTDCAQAEQVFATKCLDLWKRFKAQGNRKKATGFKKTLTTLGIPDKKAYKAMWSVFPRDRPQPTSRHNGAKLEKVPRLNLRQLQAMADNPAGFKAELAAELQAIVSVLCKNYQGGVSLTVDLK